MLIYLGQSPLVSAPTGNEFEPAFVAMIAKIMPYKTRMLRGDHKNLAEKRGLTADAKNIPTLAPGPQYSVRMAL